MAQERMAVAESAVAEVTGLRPEQIADPVVGKYTVQEWGIVDQLMDQAIRALPDSALEEVCLAVTRRDDADE